MKKRLLLLLSVLLVSCSCFGCSDYSNETAEILSGVSHYKNDLKVENIFGSSVLYFRGAMYDLGVNEISNYEYELACVESISPSLNRYLLVHLFEDDSYFLISLYYQNNNNIYKLSDSQISNINHDDFTWTSGNLSPYEG